MKQKIDKNDYKDFSIEAHINTYDLDVSAEEEAKRFNCSIVIPEPNQLQIDIDSEEAYSVFQKRIFEYKYYSQLSITIETHPSKSGLPKKHITVTVNDSKSNPHVFSEWERIALQFALGSDPIRETLNAWRLLRGAENPSRLFEPK